ncbi:MAG: type III secretion system inner membrane ring subunit SctD [Candidatus Algichlamydia australiensis]|nr:type III secretion system inner membrane ring subunit SctD [Chlamydiales bacterium]
MSAFLVAEEGTLTGLIINLDEEEIRIGRDPDLSNQVLEDPVVSRHHLTISREGDEYVAQNTSEINPATLNGNALFEPTTLSEDDILQVGGTFFRFTASLPEKVSAPSLSQPQEESPILSFTPGLAARFCVKVISGPNAGAEFGLEEGSFIIGKDPDTCDIVLQDLSVSRQHAKVSTDSTGQITIEDLKSRNSTLVNGKTITQPTPITPQDVIVLGTTSFLIIDREVSRETIFSPPPTLGATPPSKEEVEALEEEARMENRGWKEMVVPTRHMVIAGAFTVLLFIGVFGFFSLFKSEAIEIVQIDPSEEIRKEIKDFPDVEFTYNKGSGKIFLLGHVLTEVEHSELTYLLQNLPYIKTIEDNVVIDESVYEEMNALLINNPNWRSVTMTAPEPGNFIIRGYVDTIEDSGALRDYLNRNFVYLDKLDYRVIVEKILQEEVRSTLIENHLNNVTFKLNNGELVLGGRVSEDMKKEFSETLEVLKRTRGIRIIKNFVVFTTASTSRIDLTSKFKVTGSSKVGNVNEYVVINGKILSVGDTLDSMTITGIESNEILLEKDGLKFKINYNQQ